MEQGSHSNDNYYPTALTPPDTKVPVLDYASPAAEQEAQRQASKSSWSSFDFSPTAGDWSDLVTNLPYGDVVHFIGSTVEFAGDVVGMVLEGVGTAVGSIGDIF